MSLLIYCYSGTGGKCKHWKITMISPDPHLWPAFGANSEKGPTLLQNRSLKSPDSTWKSFFTLFTTYFSTKYLEQNCVVQALNFLPLTAHLRLPECWICPKTTCYPLHHWSICVLKGLLGLLGWAGNAQSRHFLLSYTHMYPKVPKSTLKVPKKSKLGLLAGYVQKQPAANWTIGQSVS